MADDTGQQGAADRAQVARGERYEVATFAKKHGLAQKVARDLIAEVGNDRERLDAAASALPSTARTRKRSAPAEPGAGVAVAIGTTAIEMVTPAVEALTESVEAAAKVVKRTARAAVKPVSDGVAPKTSAIGKRAKTVVAGARRGSGTARERVAAAPAAAIKTAGKALEATKTVAKGRTVAMLGAAAAGLVTGLAVNLGRKVAVQAPSVMAGDWFDAVKLEHKMALILFDGLEATTDAEPAKRTMLLIQLTHALSKHAFTEENVIYPALRDWGDKADADKLNHDHGYVKQHLYDLDAIDPASAAFLSKIATFRDDLEAHIAEEEMAVFPPLHAALGEAKNAALTALANKEGFKLA